MGSIKRYIGWLLLLMFFTGMGKAQKYQVGDVYCNEKGEKEGVVCWINAEGTGGCMIAFRNLNGAFYWGETGTIPGLPGFSQGMQAVTDEDGYNNTKLIRDFLGEGTQYAAQLVDFAKGWYLPAAGQMQKLVAIYSIMDKILEENGGEPLLNVNDDRRYWTSTPAGEAEAYVLTMEERKIKVDKLQRKGSYSTFLGKVRPFRNFKMESESPDNAYRYQWNIGEKTFKLVTLPKAGKNDYAVTVTSPTGLCAATARQSVFVAAAGKIVYEDTICQGERYRKNGFDTDVPGKHSKTLDLEVGCSIPISLNLVVADTFRYTLSDRFCRGSVYNKYNFTASAAGTYIQRWHSQWGCDSVVSLTLEESLPFDTTYYESVCLGEAYAGHGFRMAAVNQDTLCVRNPGTPEGCDSLIRLVLTVRNPASRHVYDTVCRGSSYRGYGHFEIAEVTQDTLCQYHTLSSTGCDSTFFLHLKVAEIPEKWVQAALCQGETYTSYGFQLTEEGSYEGHWPALTGCDTLVHLDLKVHPLDTTLLEDSVCMGEKYTGNPLFDFLPMTKDTVGEVVLSSIYGCDSLVYLKLRGLPLPEKTVQTTLQKGEIYQEYGLHTGEEGTYLVKWPAVKGCDTLVTVKLEYLRQYEKQVMASICEGGHYTEYGFDRTEPGKDTLQIEGKNGAGDTLIYLDLQVHPVYEIRRKDTICRGESYEFCGNQYTEAGIYICSLSTVWGCDSTIHLELLTGDYFEGEIVGEMQDCATYEYQFRVEGTMPEAVKFPVYHWDFGEKEILGESGMICHFADSGSYIVRCSVTSEWGCERELSRRVEVPYYPAGASILTDVDGVDEARPVVAFRTDSVAGIRYTWDFGDGERVEDAPPALTHRYILSAAISYEVRVWLVNAEGCRVEAATHIRAYPPVAIPNTFSPNGDGVNDSFGKGCRICVFDRNGLKIYEGEDGWDGSYHGKQVPADTYFYEMYLPSLQGERKQTGYITLVR